MDAETNSTQLMPGRHTATDRQSAFAGHSVSGFSEIFKKTPFVSGLHPVSRDVVKDIPEIDSIPLLTTTIDQDVSLGKVAIAGPTVAEISTAVKPHSHQGVLRSADIWTALTGAVVGPMGNRAPAASAGPGLSNGKLSDGGPAAHTSKRAARATNPASGAPVIFHEADGICHGGRRTRFERPRES